MHTHRVEAKRGRIQAFSWGIKSIRYTCLRLSAHSDMERENVILQIRTLPAEMHNFPNAKSPFNEHSFSLTVFSELFQGISMDFQGTRVETFRGRLVSS